MAISMLKIRRPLGRLIFNMGIAIPGKTVFLIETAPWPVETLITYKFQFRLIYVVFAVNYFSGFLLLTLINFNPLTDT